MANNILYTFRRCPFAMRARWALLKTRKRFLWREIKLNDKPKELIEISPKATVPVMITSSGKVLEESMDIIYWSLESYKYPLKYIADLKEIKELIKLNDTIFKSNLDIYKYSSKNKQKSINTSKIECINVLYYFNSLLKPDINGKLWLLNSNQSIADWSIWPFVRQFRNVDIDFFDKYLNLNELSLWLDQFVTSSLFNTLMAKTKPWLHSDPEIFYPNSIK